MNALVQPCSATPCAALRAELAKIERYEIDAAAAKAAYEPHDPNAPTSTRIPPAGFRNATDAELGQMNLTRSFIDNPRFEGSDGPSAFRTAVFVNDRTGERLVAFKGTSPTSLEDWAANAQQGLGNKTEYYSQAQRIATRIASSPYADQTRYTGHSLGGGLASAAARTAGRPATTFNAAGLHPDTVTMARSGGIIDAVYVRGEALTSVQQIGIPRAEADVRYALDPPDGYGRWLMLGGRLLGIKGTAAAIVARSLGLHMMGSVDRSLAERKQQVVDEIKRCC